jgi:hypothetical protein
MLHNFAEKIRLASKPLRFLTLEDYSEAGWTKKSTKKNVNKLIQNGKN